MIEISSRRFEHGDGWISVEEWIPFMTTMPEATPVVGVQFIHQGHSCPSVLCRTKDGVIVAGSLVGHRTEPFRHNSQKWKSDDGEYIEVTHWRPQEGQPVEHAEDAKWFNRLMSKRKDMNDVETI